MDIPLKKFEERISEIRKKSVRVEFVDLNIVRKDSFSKNIDGSIVYVVEDLNIYNRLIETIDENLIPYLFHVDEIYFCPLDSKYVPRHELVTDISELKRFGKGKFPKIIPNDPIAKWHGWKHDSYIRIIRENGDVFYRHLECRKRTI